MMSFKDQRVLIVAPHPDDEIFGCGGLISRCKREGGKVYILFLTVGTTKDYSKSGISTTQERLQEIERAAECMGYDGYKIAFPGNDYHLQLDVLPQKKLVDEIERGEHISLEVIKPTIVITTPSNDYNQDHRVASYSTVTATRPTPPDFKPFQPLVLTYELPPSNWVDNDLRLSRNFFVELSKEDVDTKIKALECYKSQLKNHHGPLSVHGVTTLAAMRGIECGTDFAEAYYAKRILI